MTRFARKRKANLSYHESNGVGLSYYSPEDIRKISAVQVKKDVSFDALQRPVEYGLYDSRMGPIDKITRCSTCGMTMSDCNGHFGHIELNTPVYHPLLLTEILRILNSTCQFCHRFRSDKETVFKFMKRIELIDAGLLAASEELWELADTNKTEDEANVLPKGRDVEYLQKFTDEKITEAAQDFGGSIDKLLEYTKKNRSSQIQNFREKVIREFFKANKFDRCKRCHAFNPGLTLQKNTAIFRKQLSKTKERYNLDSGHYLPSYNPADNMDKDVEQKLQEMGADSVEQPEPNNTDNNKQTASKNTFLLPDQIRQIFRNLFKNEKLVLEVIFLIDNVKRNISAETFFIECLLVPSNRFRMPAMMNGEFFENSMNAQFRDVLAANEELSSPHANFNQQLVNLQNSVNLIMDGEMDKDKKQMEHPGVRQQIDRKSGMFRQYMMGKRVNFAARSVISPDPNIETNEIGVPEVFATRLSYPEPVTPHNVKWLRRLVINGAKQYPGANYVMDESGHIKDLEVLDKTGRVALAKTLLTDNTGAPGGGTKIVGRHVKQGDAMLVNRQPTLHKPSIMAHKARVFKGVRTIRLHYANCNTYNADFDGDEMNLHLPQNEMARAEAYNIALTDHQYIIPTAGKPIRGLIQDHVVSGVLLTKKDSFFELEEYQHLVYSCLHHMLGTHKQVEMVEPCILKPKPLWSGKQIITTLLKNVIGDLPPINLESKTKVPASQWGAGNEDEGVVTVKDSELLTGILDKSQFGSSANGLVHCAYECYGGQVAGELLTCLGKLFTIHLQYYGFTCGMDDLCLTNDGDKFRRKNLDEANSKCTDVTLDFLEVPRDRSTGAFSKSALGQKLWHSVFADEGISRKLDAKVKSTLNKYRTEVLKYCLPGGQMKPFPENYMSLMTVAGAKGSVVNFSQIACVLGQQEFEGRRVKPMISGKTLPSYTMHDTSARAGGFVTGRFLSGIRPQDYFFHCMAGRDGLVDTAVKTARSGYLQRCLVKHLETLKVGYDRTVRDASNSVVQFRYGEDGVDPIHAANMTNFRFLTMNKEAMSHQFKAAEVAQKFHIENHSSPDVIAYNRKLKESNYQLDPVLSVIDPARNLGSISEQLQNDLDSYTSKNPDHMVIPDDENPEDSHSYYALPESNLRALVNLKYLRALAEPGENVGLLAAQSIGEPSTQMTLNTFHFAGVDMAHVTVGIPRLRELLMSGVTATQIMKLPLKPSVSQEEAEKLALKLSQVSALDLYKDLKVSESFAVNGKRRKRVVTAEFEFPVKEIQEAYEIDPEQLAKLCKVYLTQQIGRETKKAKRQWQEAAKKMFETQSRLFEESGVMGATEEDMEEGEDDIDKRNADDNDNDDDVDKNNDDDNSEKDEDEEDEEDPEETRLKNKKQEWDSYGDEEENGKQEKEMQEENESGDETKKDDEKVSSSESEKEDENSDNNDDDDKSVKEEDKSDNEDEEDENMENVNDKENENENENSEESVPMEIGNQKVTQNENNSDDDFMIKFQTILDKFTFLKDPKFNAKTGIYSVEINVQADMKILWPNLLERAAEKALFVKTPNIYRTVVDDSDSSKLSLAMEGANFQEVWRYPDLIDLHNVTTNDVQLVIDTFGVEAGRKMIAQELKQVFDMYSITVDPRHLSLISEYMTFEGGQRAFNRRSMTSNPSPFLQMSYEQALTSGVQASLYGRYENLKSPAARLVMGRSVSGGTGSFQIVQELKTNKGKQGSDFEPME